MQSYVLRNAILSAAAEVLVQMLNGDQLEEAARDTRDQFLAILQTHVCDVNSFVRSRVLQLFTRIVQCRVSLCCCCAQPCHSSSPGNPLLFECRDSSLADKGIICVYWGSFAVPSSQEQGF